MTSKKVPLLILLVISFALSRFVFFLIDDPEGPNLLIVTVLAMLIFVPASLVYQKLQRLRDQEE